jgi:hypothetical protein
VCIPFAGAVVPGAQPPAVVVDGAQLTVPMGPGVAPCVALVGVAGVTPVVGLVGLVSVPLGAAVPVGEVCVTPGVVV